MNEQRNEKRIDELLSRAINTEKPQFDVEKWKQQYPEEYQILTSRSDITDSIRRSKSLKIFLKSTPAKIATAAVIILAVSFLIMQQLPNKQERTNITNIKKTPTEMMSAVSLKIAFRKGGMEAVEEQYNEAYKQLGPRPKSLSVEQMLTEFNGT